MSTTLPLTDGTTTLEPCTTPLKGAGPTPLKLCPYCQRLHPEDDFHRLVKGRGGKIIVYQCGPCYKARQNPAANKERLEIMVSNNKLANKRAFIFPSIPKGRGA